MNFSESLFTDKKDVNILDSIDNCEIIYVADLFAEDYRGGAELTTQALLDASPLNICKIHSKNINMEILERGHKKYWIFSNFTSMDLNFIPTIIANLKYSIIEYDYKYCQYRSMEKHMDATGKECDCHDQEHGKLISALYLGAQSLWWMSEQQMDHYFKLFPFLEKNNNTVLSSVFDDETFAYIKNLNETYKDKPREGWVVLGSNSWIKGADSAEQWCIDNNKKYEIVWNLPYHEVLEKLASSEGFVYLPKGGDTCPRMVIEAKLLGCKLELNDYVQHQNEIWFNTDIELDTLAYLYMARSRFWTGIKHVLNYNPNLSGYTTTLNCVKNNYPFEECIKSMLGFCDEVIVVDGGSKDGTLAKLNALAKQNDKLIIHKNARDWSDERFAVYDGAQKAFARSLCTGKFCWQMDADEIIHENDYQKVRNLVKHMPKNMDVLALPVIEFWGNKGKVRIDVNPWKWRLSRNVPHITHGIPIQLRRYDENGQLYSAPGSDGCDYIRNDNYQIIPFSTFYTQDIHEVRASAIKGNKDSLKNYEQWIHSVTDQLPTVLHFSWWDIKRKILTYKKYWSKHWQSLYNLEINDSAESNMMFDVPWKKVTDEMITDRAKELEKKTGGWIFHTKWNGQKISHITTNKELPKVMKNWV
jgi:glycosyltransferase involved in cell wall biosynthesis